MNKYIFIKERDDIPEGFRKLTEEEIARDFVKLDAGQDYFISKNEWMLKFIKMWENELPALDAEAPDAIMSKIQKLSDEFDKYDLDKNKYIDYIEYKNFLCESVLVSE